ncbi:chorismate mutase [Blattabacterium cuenoti]|uniref:chorismate mutase n=1 Tax=Blattabacterium cuenoti TaxID=1653831 RepID=UPI00163C3D85|nr:chorismate mutase [Blattabacterium cuenoti]
MNNNIDRSWIDKWEVPFVISGPCSAENEQQVLETAKRLKESCHIQIFRAGIWKPRTKPNNFEGVGEKGLKWLQEVKRKFGIMVATEVANAKHVEQCIGNDIDVLWIGARSTASPFTIQEIAEALEGSNPIVLVKNPIHPDLELWIGALERLLKKGIRKLGVIHRGFFIYKHSKYRNQPNWNILLELRKIISNIPIICDPSHICGNRKGIMDITNKAFHFPCDGIMIESHCNPDKAWSDAQQQITPENLYDILKRLNIRSKDKSKINLDSLRILIDELDENIIFLLAKRMKISKELGTIKKNLDIAIFQPERWKYIIKRYISIGKNLGLSEKLLENIFEILHKESVEIQQNKVSE